MFHISELDRHKQDRAEAKRTIATLEAAKILATNNDFGCEVHIGGLVIGVSENTHILPIIEAEIAEINKFLAGEPNAWE